LDYLSIALNLGVSFRLVSTGLEHYPCDKQRILDHQRLHVREHQSVLREKADYLKIYRDVFDKIEINLLLIVDLGEVQVHLEE
jgi:hypothetical protein